MTTGFEAEELFRNVMLSQGRDVKMSSKDENMFDHIDLYVDGESYDVKGTKRFDRKYNDRDDTIWIESTNVKGDKGWLFGKAKYIAFLVRDEFWVLPRVKLVDYIEKEITCPTVFPIKRYKRWYSRQGMRDMVTYVYPRDIRKLVTTRVKV